MNKKQLIVVWALKSLFFPILLTLTVLITENTYSAKPVVKTPSEEPVSIHLIRGNKEWFYEKVDSLTINNRIKESAEELMKEGIVARMAEYDLGLPADSKEYNDLDKNAVVMVVALTHNKTELPLKRVYIDYSEQKIDLERILSKMSEVKDETVKRAFGDYREDSFYLIPIHFLIKNCELVIDWRKNRDGFVLARYPIDVADYIEDDNNLDKQSKQLNEKSLKDFLKREYSIILK